MLVVITNPRKDLWYEDMINTIHEVDPSRVYNKDRYYVTGSSQKIFIEDATVLHTMFDKSVEVHIDEINSLFAVTKYDGRQYSHVILSLEEAYRLKGILNANV